VLAGISSGPGLETSCAIGTRKILPLALYHDT